MDPEIENEIINSQGIPESLTAPTDITTNNADVTSDLLISKLQEFMQVGGPVVWILTVLSIIALAIVLIKIGQFLQTRPESSGHLEKVINFWKQGDTNQALALLKRKRPVDELIQLAMQGLNNAHIELDTLKEELDRIATLRLNQLRAYLRPLEVIATLSPLLGLLGTVLGMIIAFQQMEAAGNQVDPSVLSGGIWQALLTTAVGLAVAIPVVMAHNWMERKVERVAALMNDTVTRVFTSARAVESAHENAPIRHAA
ncbi:MotA/TolQ/ExbB proton channel family protein [Methylophaga sp.]|uniref:MotA/TolQ/ExbB proton channel family protein n=1 Tax=Methylophaga sp. TaxID=2024840 RepID=UPI003F69A2AE